MNPHGLKCENQKGYIGGLIYPEYSVAWLIPIVGFDSGQYCYSTVFNVAATKNSWLASTLQQVPGPTGSKILVTERPGRSVRANMCTANHFPRATCGRLLCPEARRGEECCARAPDWDLVGGHMHFD